MDYKKLLEKYKVLLGKNNSLSEENNLLKAKLAKIQNNIHEGKSNIPNELSILNNKSTDNFQLTEINNKPDSISKITLFMSLFKGRDDVYATQWKNKKKEKSGYSPVCLNQWQSGLCDKAKVSCSKCKNKSYAALDEYIVAGIYPMLSDESCYFLAMDFDEEGWKNDVSTVRKLCDKFNIYLVILQGS